MSIFGIAMSDCHDVDLKDIDGMSLKLTIFNQQHDIVFARCVNNFQNRAVFKGKIPRKSLHFFQHRLASHREVTINFQHGRLLGATNFVNFAIDNSGGHNKSIFTFNFNENVEQSFSGMYPIIIELFKMLY